MAEPRKIFRIEQTIASRLAPTVAEAQAPLRHNELMHEISGLRAMLAAMAREPGARPPAPSNGGIGRLASELHLIADAIGGGEMKIRGQAPTDAGPMTRIGHELMEVVKSTERATQQVLAATEEIDQVAKNLSVTLRGNFEQGLVQDIQDLVIRIFEACNFQDLAGQRITKVLSILDFVEDHVGRVLEDVARDAAATGHEGAKFLHGPRLDSDSGHVTQAEIDAMFES